MENSTNPVAASVASSLVSQREILTKTALAKRTNNETDSSIIRDSLETSDRQPDGRRPLRQNESDSKQNGESSLSKGEHLDLTG